ncbi:MAG: hypothetical protein DRR16_14475 [Candidatus Parabeggiatoa sp. nov. 3]|nr:MAG: hypothetical protein DRR00_07875 [Gammaproteobacteria bacterium]RKZ68264.1 MAG: hypothetical protein DRQ99_04290 [Gammaproteobacteria bacterium]RKZ84524.1 MAG: hypothetical protein DRR16_14475 [Gammaproteobacteria bacterium]
MRVQPGLLGLHSNLLQSSPPVESIMSYRDFKTVAEVTTKFGIKVNKKPFIDTLSLKITPIYFTDITEKLNSTISFINEVATCEDIIKPILNLVEKKYDALHVWSHVTYNVNKEKGLVGEPDYLIAPMTVQALMSIPPICVIEAKQEKFDEGWAQALAEMIAASSQGMATCYSIVTTGKAWEFAKLENNVFTKVPNQISATDNLQKVFDTLNWLFDRANKLLRNELKTT